MPSVVRWPLALLLGLVGCGYTPPAQTDVAAPAYRTDLTACEDTASKDVNTHNAKTGLAWFASPVRRWGQISDATQACMVGKGYGRVRWCSADELRSGTRSGNVVVTSSGVQCSDPPNPERRRSPT